MNRYILPVLLAIVSSGVALAYIDPFYSSINAGNAKIQQYEGLIADAKTAETKLSKLKETQQNFPSGYDRSLAKILPSSVDPLRLVIDINGIAALRGLHLKGPRVSLESDTKKNIGSIRKNTLTFGINAPYTVFRAFLRDIESDLALQDMSQLSFSSDSPSSDSTPLSEKISPELRIYDYQVSLVTYSLPQ